MTAHRARTDPGVVPAAVGGVICAWAVVVAGAYPSDTGWLARGAGSVGALVALAFLGTQSVRVWRKQSFSPDSQATAASIGQEVVTLLLLVAFPLLVIVTNFWIALIVWCPLFMQSLGVFSYRRAASVILPLAVLIVVAQNFLSVAVP